MMLTTDELQERYRKLSAICEVEYRPGTGATRMSGCYWVVEGNKEYGPMSLAQARNKCKAIRKAAH